MAVNCLDSQSKEPGFSFQYIYIFIVIGRPKLTAQLLSDFCSFSIILNIPREVDSVTAQIKLKLKCSLSSTANGITF